MKKLRQNKTNASDIKSEKWKKKGKALNTDNKHGAFHLWLKHMFESNKFDGKACY